MSELDTLQQRITAALDKISQGIEGLGTATSSGEADQTAAALEDEKIANAQLKDRIKSLKERHEAELTGLRQDVAEKTKLLGRFDSELAALRRTNQSLRENNAALREANSQGVGDPHLINKSMMAELDALRAVRAADDAEFHAVLHEISQVVEPADPVEMNKNEDA